MVLPDYRGFMKPVLQAIENAGGFMKAGLLPEALADHMYLSPEDITSTLPSGRETVFENRYKWAVTYLEQVNLIEFSNNDGYRITEQGRNYLNKKDVDLYPHPAPHNSANSGYSIANRQAPQSPADDISYGNECENRECKNPVELLTEQFSIARGQLKDALLKRICAQTPQFFEILIIDLLVKMGYGKSSADLASHLGRSGDGGVDGMIKQDQLGLDTIYIQAKRFRPETAVPVAAVRDFAGSLEAHKANKGVFVTTSHFTSSGLNFIDAISKRVILLDGEKLVSLMVRHDIGVRHVETYEVKHLDEAYFS